LKSHECLGGYALKPYCSVVPKSRCIAPYPLPLDVSGIAADGGEVDHLREINRMVADVHARAKASVTAAADAGQGWGMP
jgi:hypothetical protein